MLADVARERIGKTNPPVIFEIEKGAIKRFADAVDDYNPLFRDEEYARNSRNGAIVTVPGFFGWPSRLPRGSTLAGIPEPDPILGPALIEEGFLRGLDGGMEYEFFLPIRVGDTLTCCSSLKDIKERDGGSGKMVFVSTELTYHNQHGDLVATAVSTSIFR